MPPSKDVPQIQPGIPAQQIRTMAIQFAQSKLISSPSSFQKLLQELGRLWALKAWEPQASSTSGPAFPEMWDETLRSHISGQRGLVVTYQLGTSLWTQRFPLCFYSTFFRLLLRGTQIAFETVFHCVLKASPSMSINISSYSWNKSFLCSILLPTGAQMACFMWWPLFTIQLHGGPWDATNEAHTGRQPLGQGHLSRQARSARKGHTLKVHGEPLPLTYILRSGPVGSWASPEAHREGGFAQVTVGRARPVAVSRENSTHKMPKTGHRLKNINKANPSLPRRLATIIGMFKSIC